MKKTVGYIDVDAGIVQVGDPCYTLANHDRPGVAYGEMINRLIDHDDVQLKISHEQIKAIHEHSAENPYHPRSESWDEPVLTSLSPAPEDKDGVVHKWQPVYNPYGHKPAMGGDPHSGAGLVVSSGWGDGSYPVEIEWDDAGEYWEGRPPVTFEFDGETRVSDPGAPPSVFHRIKSVKITFIDDDNDSENAIDEIARRVSNAESDL